ncbi:hypothetical protein D1871_18970 [Nakamurella silvestris]|nr:hypothetical protein D1871_18970 [Nakamurella silvestris]
MPAASAARAQLILALSGIAVALWLRLFLETVEPGNGVLRLFTGLVLLACVAGCVSACTRIVRAGRADRGGPPGSTPHG